MSARATLAIDATAARTGGGPSRVSELSHSFPVLSDQIDYLFFVRPAVATGMVARGNVFVRPVPRALNSLPGRLVWEHLYLPRRLARERVQWMLSPFNVLPLGSMPTDVRTAVIVSNVAPFMPEILGAEGAYQRARNAAIRRLTLMSLRRADLVFALSQYSRRLLGSIVSSPNVVILPMAPPPPPVLARAEGMTHANRHDSARFVIPGNLYPYKGVEDAISAVWLIRQRGVGAHLEIYGDPLNRTYAHRLAGMSSRTPGDVVSFYSGRDQAHVLSRMKTSVATLICSRVENMSRVPVEAMAVGSPIIATDIEPTREACGDAALYYEAGDVGALAARMSEVLDPDRRAHLIRRGYQRLEGVDWLSASRAILKAMELI